MIEPRTRPIRTPEGISFPLIIASPVLRFLALGIDLAAIGAATSTVMSLTVLLGLVSWDLWFAVGALSAAVMAIGYPIVMEWFWRGQTLGKMMLRLQVMDAQGLRLHFSQVAIRNLLRAVDVIPGFYMIGGISAWLNDRGQRLGDLAANTIVVRHPIRVKPDFDQILPGKYNSFRDYPHLAARLRQTALPREAGIALAALLRRGQFEDQARVELFAELRAHFERAVPFPPEVTDGLSDEQYVRNVTDILFR